MKTDYRFHHKIRVRFADTDMQGIVFNGNYLTYYDVAWTEYFRAAGLEYKDFEKFGADTVLARTEMDFKSPARFDEVLEVYARVASIGNKSLTFNFEIHPEGEERLIGTALSVYVCISPQTLRPITVPEALRKLLGEFEGREL